MCNKFTEGALSDYTDGALPWYQAFYVQQHLRRCETCAQAVRLLRNLNHEAQSLYADAVPLWAADSSPKRRSAIRPVLLVACASSVAAAAWFGPEMPGRPRIAFADVENAMRHVQTAQWQSIHIVYNETGNKEEEIHYQHWAQLKPLLYAWQAHTIFARDAKTNALDGMNRVTEWESVGRDAHGDWYSIAASDKERAQNKRIPVEMDINNSLFPWDAAAKTPKPASTLAGAPVWQQKVIQERGRSLVRLYSVYVQPTFRRADEMWVDQATHRLVRHTITNTFYRKSSAGSRIAWRNVVNAADHFRYNEPLPETVVRFGAEEVEAKRRKVNMLPEHH